MTHKIITPPPSTSYKENYDKIFQKKNDKHSEEITEAYRLCKYCDVSNNFKDSVCRNCGEELN